MTAAFLRQMRAVPPIPRGNEFSGVYILLDQGEVVYVGSSNNVPFRVKSHVDQAHRNRPYSYKFDDSMWLHLPGVVLAHYEGALIRALKPRYNRSAPVHRGHDDEILNGLNLGHLSTDGWVEHFRTARAQARAVEHGDA